LADRLPGLGVVEIRVGLGRSWSAWTHTGDQRSGSVEEGGRKASAAGSQGWAVIRRLAMRATVQAPISV